jgi:hypothetical protein
MRITDEKKREIGELLADKWSEGGVYINLGKAAVTALTPVLLAPPKDDELAEIAGCDDLVARYIREAFKNRIAQIMRKPDPAIAYVENIMLARGWSDPDIWAPVLVDAVDKARKETA